MIRLGHGSGAGGDGRGGGGRNISGGEMLGRGHIVGWYNTGQEEGILLPVKIHLVRNKRPSAPIGHILLLLLEAGEDFLDRLCYLAFSALMTSLKVSNGGTGRYCSGREEVRA